ncbi:zinc ABC transporter substrate-binding protein [Paracoccus fontiphilus]|uniref:High-affinity zinc uptake system protein ZnuA n=1 Tax=Paracoccus fontiphilus TaxID=1815556 RepID=A0ABV7IEX1_9RHOB|nr:zinc ABC transporter substrate-binding protein [Paracoccus fontiphilus]
MRLVLSTLALLAAFPALAEQPQVVADTSVTASLVRQVMGEEAQVRVLLPQGASVHHHQLRPSDARGLQEAGLLVWTGPELTPWLARSAGSLSGDVMQLRLLEVPETHLRNYAGADDHDHDHDHDHEHGHDHSPDDHDHVHSGTDPHAWLDPTNARLWLTAIADTLAKADPDNAGLYAQNAKAAAQRIAELDADLQAQLAPHKEASFVVFHDAYGYFTEHYGLRPAIPVSLGDASTPSAARLSAIRAEIEATGATCAFPEYASDPRLVRTAVEGTDIRMGDELSPEGGAAEAGPGLYADVLTSLATALTDCLSDR